STAATPARATAAPSIRTPRAPATIAGTRARRDANPSPDERRAGSVEPGAMSARWVRSAAALVVSTRDAVTVVSPSGEARRFTDASADLVRAALDFWASPHTEAELVAHLRALAGECDPALVAETRACL